MNISQFVKALRKELPDIREDADESWNWCDEGFDLLDGGELLLAELKFQELILSQPECPDGYEGLALVCRDLERLEDAFMLIAHALELARRLRRKDFVDAHVVTEIQAEHDEIAAALARRRANDARGIATDVPLPEE